MIHGITIDDIDKLQYALPAIRELAVRATVRVVIDDGRPLSDYKEPVRKLSHEADVMIEVMDSYNEKGVDEARLLAKAESLWGFFGDMATHWEISSETNGEWESDQAVRKGQVLSQFFKKKGAKSRVVTLFSAENLTDFVQANRIECELLMLSFYPSDLNARLDLDSLINLFALWGPQGIGIGEFGVENFEHANRFTEEHLIDYVGSLRHPDPRWIGGGFYWDFQKKCVPAHRPLWNALQESWRA